jgi:glycosyltransferase involved in cell wall biosynthesis
MSSGREPAGGLPAAFVAAGPVTFASSRLQVHRPLEALAAAEPGQWHLLRSPDRYRPALGPLEAARILSAVLRGDIRTVIFQKVRKGAAPLLMALLRRLGRQVVYIEADERRRLGFTRHVDRLVAPSARLASELERRTGKPVAVIPDPIEYHEPDALALPWQARAPFRALWVGSKNNWHQVEALKAMLSQQGIDAFHIITVSNHPQADVRWSLESVRQELARADLGIIPLSADSHSQMKSHNRATLFMALGVPLIVSRSPVYQDLVVDGETGFTFGNADDLAALPARLADHALVERVRAAAMARAGDYAFERLLPLWRQVVGC